MNKIKIALVSYINTIPFTEAIKTSPELKGKVELIEDYPAKCAELIKNKQVDGGLIPLGALHEVSDMEIMTNYCIGANGAVDTVAIFSNQELQDIKTIYLDYQSRTSAQLIQILAQKYWKQKFIFLPTQEGFENSIPKNSAILIIGDRVFEYEHNYKYKIDLSEEWKKHTSLPFVFALWVGNKKFKTIESELNNSFLKSLSDIPRLYHNLLTINQNTFVNYLSHKIDYIMDNKKREAIRLFTRLKDYR